MPAKLLLVVMLFADDPDRPPLPSDLNRFLFTDKQITDNAKFSSTHAEWACGDWQMFLILGRVGGQVWYRPCREQALYCEACWDALLVAKRNSSVENLAKLRLLLGQESYETGQMPPVAPYWFFRVIE
jgi:hypothetical protein